MANPHKEIRYKYESYADTATRMSRKAEIGIGVGSLAVFITSVVGAHYGLENEQPAVAITLGGTAFGASIIGSRMLAHQVDDGLTALTNRFPRKQGDN